MTTEQLQEEFKQILAYGYKRGNEETPISTQELVQELVEMMKKTMMKMKEQA